MYHYRLTPDQARSLTLPMATTMARYIKRLDDAAKGQAR